MKILIKNGIITNSDKKPRRADILIADGVIRRIAENITTKADQVVEAEGLHVFPGFIDMHCHLREPGFEYKEDIASGTRAATAGGFTAVACMANTNPVNDNKTVTYYIRRRAEETGLCRVYPIGALSKGMKGEEISEMEQLRWAGAVAVSDDGKPVVSSGLMKRAMQYAAMFNLPVISHCEDIELCDEGSMNEGYTSTVLGLRGIPAAAEASMVSRDLIISEYTGAPVHIAHVSTALSVELIRQAKKRGVKATCETCPHYFSLTDEECAGFNTFAKVNPPLRSAKDVAAVIEGIKDGTIDAIATDHAPHHPDEKNTEFAAAANGLVGFETALGVCVKYLIKPGHITPSGLARLMSARPAEILHVPGGRIEKGAAADLTLVDMDKEWTVDPDKFKGKGKNTAFAGKKLTGCAVKTIVAGKIVYDAHEENK